jgi:hypothetical protein
LVAVLVVVTAPAAHPSTPEVAVLDDFHDFANARFAGTLINRWRVPFGGSPWSEPGTVGEPWPSGGGISQVTTPQGRGFRFVVTPEMKVASGGKLAQIADIDHLVRGPEHVEDWAGMIMFPRRGNPRGFPSGYRDWGALLEFTTGAELVHTQLGIDSVRNRLYFRVLDPRTGGRRKALARRPLAFDHWYAFRIRIKWSYSDDGFAQFWLDDRRLASWTGATLRPGELPNVYFGFYSAPRLRNEVIWAGLRRSVEPA